MSRGMVFLIEVGVNNFFFYAATLVPTFGAQHIKNEPLWAKHPLTRQQQLIFKLLWVTENLKNQYRGHLIIFPSQSQIKEGL